MADARETKAAGGSGKWTPAEERMLLMQVVRQAVILGDKVNMDTVTVTGRTTRSIKERWTILKKEAAEGVTVPTGEGAANGKAKAKPAAKSAAKGKKRGATDESPKKPAKKTKKTPVPDNEGDEAAEAETEIAEVNEEPEGDEPNEE